MTQIKLLSIGNSFSEDAQKYLHKLARKNGVDIECHNLFIGGCSLECHYNNMKNDLSSYRLEINGVSADKSISIKDALLSEEWNYVTLQQCSNQSPYKSSYHPYAKELVDYIRKLCPSAKILIHKTWSYSKDVVSKAGFSCSRDMYSRIERAYRKFADTVNADGIIPAGETVERMMNLKLNTHRDGLHLSLGEGRYAAALTFFCYLTGINAEKTQSVELDEEISEENITTIKSCVNAALNNDGYYYPMRTSFDTPYAISYRGDIDTNPERALDIYMPDKEGFDAFVYFHGGGFVTGDKDGDFAITLARYFTDNGIAFISANYRMYPNAVYPDFIQDAALAVKYVKNNIQNMGGSGKVFVGGTSAGGYLSQMLCFDRKYLGFNEIEPTDIAGFIHDAGQPTTHFNVLNERGLDPKRLVVDEAAPLYYVGISKEYAPMLFILADNDMPNRAEQTELLLSTMKHFGYDMSKTEKIIIPNSTHSSYCQRLDDDGAPVFAKVIVDFIKKH